MIDKLREAITRDEPEDHNATETPDDTDYDGPRLGEPVKFTVVFGPEQGVGVMPVMNGGIYVTPQSAYQMRDGDWVDLEVNTETMFQSVATYVNPQEIRSNQQMMGGNK